MADTDLANEILDRLDEVKDRPWTAEEAESAAVARRAGGGR